MGRAGHGFFLVSRGGRVRSDMATRYLLLAHASPVLLAKDRLSSGLFSFFFSLMLLAFSDWGNTFPELGQDIKKGENGKTRTHYWAVP